MVLEWLPQEFDQSDSSVLYDASLKLVEKLQNYFTSMEKSKNKYVQQRSSWLCITKDTVEEIVSKREEFSSVLPNE